MEVKTIIYDRHRGISVQPLVLTPYELRERQRLGDDFIDDILSKGRTLYEKNGGKKRTSRDAEGAFSLIDHGEKDQFLITIRETDQ